MQASDRPERPIESSDEDVLNRAPFVRRLVDALVSRTTGKSTGVVVGVTGPWGSGKSSILNMLSSEIKAQHPSAHVVRFDPWLVSGRNDLVMEFLSELSSVLHPAEHKAKGVVKAISSYGEALAPLVPVAGTWMETGAKLVRKKLENGESIAALRSKLIASLAKVEGPIVVLIDELDRVEDDEIRTVAQLVRSVADFASISYVLAYDVRRVVQALGRGGADVERGERGRAYLEKIVQFAFPIPLMLPDELERLLVGELQALSPSLRLPTNFDKLNRYKSASALLLASGISTPRDVKRLVGTFHVVCGMVGPEADWIDLLVFCGLMSKAPQTVELIKSQPDRYVSDPLSEREVMAMVASSAHVEWEALVGASEDSEGNRSLLGYLFPRIGRDRTIDYGDALALRRPLLTVLRFAVIPGQASRADVNALFASTADRVAANLEDIVGSEKFASMFDRLQNLYPGIEGAVHSAFWSGAAQFLASAAALARPLMFMRSVSGSLSSLLELGANRDPSFANKIQDIVEALILQGDVAILPSVFRDQFFAHGLYGTAKRDGIKIMTGDLIKHYGAMLSSNLRSRHLTGNLLQRLYNVDAIFLMMNVGDWDESCRDAVNKALDSPETFERLMMMLFGASHSTSNIDVICSKKKLEELAILRLESGGFEVSPAGLEVSLRKFLDRNSI